MENPRKLVNYLAASLPAGQADPRGIKRNLSFIFRRKRWGIKPTSVKSNII